MEYMPQVKVSKKDLLALNDLAGDMSIMDYMSKVIREHVAAQQGEKRTGAWVCRDCSYRRSGLECADCGMPRH